MNALLAPAFTLRRMHARDIGAVAAIEAQAYGFPWSRGNFVDSLAAGYLCEVLEAPDTGVVGYFVAMVGVGELHLLNLTVAPAWQSRGLGRRALGALQARCRERALPLLWLEVRAGNVRAQALYRQRGFADVGLRRGYYPAPQSTREDAIVMRLQVPPEAGDAVD